MHLNYLLWVSLLTIPFLFLIKKNKNK